jgi:hypothetical protein
MIFNCSGSGGVAVSAGLDDLLLEGPLQQLQHLLAYLYGDFAGVKL